jgi:hypothetical protein
MFSILHKNNETPSGWILIIEIILWVTLIIIIVVNIKWLSEKDFNIKAEINNLFDDKLTDLNIFAVDNDHIANRPNGSTGRGNTGGTGTCKGNTGSIGTGNMGNTGTGNTGTGSTGSQYFNSQPQSQSKEPAPKNSDRYEDLSANKCKQEEDGEVFHVESNTYTYNDAKNVCKLLGSRLATYEEVEQAYQNGANWCSYGWSDEQLALFPIQKSLYNQLKTIPGHQHDCGRPGVNGGYIEDGKTKFGVNCYGKKPYMTDKDAEYMKKYTYTPTISPEEQEKIDNRINDILIAPFNKDKWSFD